MKAAGTRCAKRGEAMAGSPRAASGISAKTGARASPAPSPASKEQQREIASAAVMAVRQARAIAVANMPMLAVKIGEDPTTAPLHMLATQVAWRARLVGL